MPKEPNIFAMLLKRGIAVFLLKFGDFEYSSTTS
jgi:hypothetical protein